MTIDQRNWENEMESRTANELVERDKSVTVEWWSNREEMQIEIVSSSRWADEIEGESKTVLSLH